MIKPSNHHSPLLSFPFAPYQNNKGVETVNRRGAFVYLIFHFQMRKVLRVKVNVLIENNRLQLQKKEKELLLSKKKQEKYSYSHYEEPSLQLGISRPALPQPLPEDPDLVFQKRFQEVERTNYRQQSMEDLQKEQYYLRKIVQGLQAKVGGQRLSRQQAASVVVLPKVNSLPRDKENGPRQYRLHRVEKQPLDDSQDSQSRGTDHSHHSQIAQLQDELAHLQDEYAQLQAEQVSLSGEVGTFIQSENVEMRVADFEVEIGQAARAVVERRAEVNELKAGISSDSKCLIKNTLSEQQTKRFSQQISALEAEISKRRAKNKEKNSYLKIIHGKKEGTVENSSASMTLNIPHPSDISTISTVLTTHTSKSGTETSKKLKHQTTLDLESHGSLEEQVNCLLKKKETIVRATQAETKKWKQAYTEKLRKIIASCSNLSELQALSSNLEGQREGKVETGVLRGRMAVTDS